LSVPNPLTATESPETSPTKDNREIKFIEFLGIGLEPVQAAIKAGYSKNYAYCHAKRKLNSPTFIAKVAKYAEKLPESRTTLAKLRLPKLYHIEDKFLARCEDEPELYARYAKISEREYKLAGLLKDEVNIQAIVPIQVAIQIQGHVEAQQSKVSQITLDSDDND